MPTQVNYSSNTDTNAKTVQEQPESSFSLSNWIPDEFLKCFQCSSFHRDLRFLPCLHSICASCIEYQEKTDPELEIFCELCCQSTDKFCSQLKGIKFRRKTLVSLLPHYSQNDLKNSNVFVRGLHELALCLTRHSKQSCDYCQFDGKVRLASYRCVQCKDDLCETCVAAHKKTKCTRNHALLSYKDIRAGLHLDKLRFSPPTSCEECLRLNKSSEECNIASFFCLECSMLLCSQCRHDDRKCHHLDHKCNEIEEAEANARLNIHKLVEKVDSRSHEIKNQLDKLLNYLEDVDERAKLVEEKLKERVKKLHNHLDLIEQEMNDELFEACEREKCLATEKIISLASQISQWNSSKIYASALEQYSRSDELLKSESTIKSFIEETIDFEILPQYGNININYSLPEDYSTDSYCSKQLRSMIGVLKIKLDMDLITKLDQESSLAESCEEKVLETNTESKIDSLERKDNHISHWKLKLFPNYSTCFKQPNERKIISNISLVSQFDASNPSDRREIWPTGLDLNTSTGDIYIIDRDNSNVKVFSEHGSLRYTFGNSECFKRTSSTFIRSPIFSPTSSTSSLVEDRNLTSPFDLTVLSKSDLIYITDYHLEDVIEYNSDGTLLRMLSQYDSAKFEHPRGIASLEENNLLAVVESRIHTVLVFDKRISFGKPVIKLGATRENFSISEMLTEPYYVDFVPMNSDIGLVVTDNAAPCLKMYSLSYGRLLDASTTYGISPQQIFQPFGVSWSWEFRKCFVVDHGNHRIQQIGYEEDKNNFGQMETLLDKKTHDLWHPLAVKFDERRQKLVLTQALGNVKIFNIN